MEVHNAAAAFATLPPSEQVEVLAVLAHELTVMARASYEVGGLGLTEPERVRAVNEVQHRVTGHIVSLLRNNPGRYPDGVLIEIVLGHDDPILQGRIEAVFNRALGSVVQPA